MGEAQSDDSKQPVYSQPQSLNTTRCIQKELNDTDMVLHVGDISYAIGYGAIVSWTWSQLNCDLHVLCIEATNYTCTCRWC